ncbi:MAG: hypothetical protein ACYC5M_00605 [Anaerolineae bacterium]
MHWLWLLPGGLVGCLNALSQRWTVTRLQTLTPAWSVAVIVGGFVLRTALAGGILLLAFRQGLASGLIGFAGLWLARWLLLVFMIRAEGKTEASIWSRLWS